MFERSKLDILKKRVREPRRHIQIITGPRQVGKTTMLNQLLKYVKSPVLYESADAISAANTTWLEQIWESARLQMKAQSSEEYLLIIDEVQKNTISSRFFHQPGLIFL